jgi:hypothetical protein|tara:strand:+ start:60 stop:1112 length:1053 start_codon:yes stop_codon:yes gene_type:complete
MANGQQTTQIAREAPFLEDYRRRLLDSVFGGTYTQADKDAGLIPQGKDVGDKRPGLADTRAPQFQRGIRELTRGEQAGIAEAQRTLGIDPATGQRTGVASFEPFLQRASAGLDSAQATTALGIPSLQQAQQQFDPTTANTAAFMNQYQADVTKEALKQLDEQAAKAQANLATQAQKAGAFGGARFGVQEAELAKNLQDIKSRRVFEDLSRNFLQAQQQAIGTSEAARARNLQAAPVFGQLGGQSAQIAQGIGNIGAQQFGLQQQGISSLLGTGGVQRTRDQAVEDELFRFRTAEGLEPRTRVQFASDILSRTPSVQSTLTQQPFPYTNPLAAAAGMGVSALGGIGAFFNQ